MPMRLDDGWNQIQFNLSDFTRRAYGTNYIETLRVQVRRLHDIKQYLFKFFHLLVENINIITFFFIRFMQTAESDVSTSPIGCIRKMNYQPNSNYSFLLTQKINEHLEKPRKQIFFFKF